MTHIAWIIPFAIGTGMAWFGSEENDRRIGNTGILIMGLVFIVRINA